MNIIHNQLIVIVTMIFMTIFLWIQLKKMELLNGELGEKMWKILSYNKTKGMNDCVEISEGCYRIGNGMCNDIKIRSAGEKVRFLLHVQKEQIYLTVLKGTVRTNHCSYDANAKELIAVGDYEKIYVGDCQLQFTRVR